MSLIFVSPTEPAALRQIGKVTMRPENNGCDVLIHGASHSLGIQRKAVPDLLASIEDGRLAEQLRLMEGLDHRIIVIEGALQWQDGHLITDKWGKQMSVLAWAKTLMSIRSTGCHVEYTRSVPDTAAWCLMMADWCDAEIHSTLQPVSARVKGAWGERKMDHYRQQLLQSLPGVGAGLARRILDTVGWPLRLDRDLSEVKGLGPKKLEAIEQMFNEQKDG